MGAQKDIGVGVIGLGMGASVLPLNQETDTRLVVRGACSVEPAAEARSILDRWGVPFFTADHEELVRRDDVDIVAVFSPDDLHLRHCRAALEADKHVVCTKPLAERSEDALELWRLAERKGLKFLVGQTFRFEPQSLALRRLWDTGQLGSRILVAEAHFMSDVRHLYGLTPWRLKKRWLLGAGCHPIDALRWFLGDIDEIQAYANVGGLSEYASEDNYLINLRFRGNAIGRVLLLMGCVQSPEPMYKLGIYADGGTAVASSSDRRGGKLEYVSDAIISKPVARMEFPPTAGTDRYGHTATVLRFMKYFESCVATGVEPSPNALDGAKTIIAAEAAEMSIRTGKPVRVSNDR